MRSVVKQLSLIKLALAEGKAKPPEKDSVNSSGGGGASEGSVSDAMLAKIVAASSGNHRLSDKDEKAAEELSASQARLEILSKDNEAVKILSDLAKVAESDVGDDKVVAR